MYAPNGVSPEYLPHEDDTPLPVDLQGCPYLLHVDSSIPRKHIDVLLDVFAAVRPRVSDLRLVQVGGPWTAARREQIERLCLGDAVIRLRGLTRPQLAAIYRRAAASGSATQRGRGLRAARRRSVGLRRDRGGQ